MGNNNKFCDLIEIIILFKHQNLFNLNIFPHFGKWRFGSFTWTVCWLLVVIGSVGKVGNSWVDVEVRRHLEKGKFIFLGSGILVPNFSFKIGFIYYWFWLQV